MQFLKLIALSSIELAAIMAKAIGAAIKAARQARGLTLRQVALATRMAIPQLASLEAGRPANPGWKTVVVLARALGISLDSVIGQGRVVLLPTPIPKKLLRELERTTKALRSAQTSVEQLQKQIKSGRS